MLEITNFLSNHRYDNVSKMKYHKKVQGQKNDKDEDKNENLPQLSFMMDRICYCCGRVRHKSLQFCYKDRPKN